MDERPQTSIWIRRLGYVVLLIAALITMAVYLVAPLLAWRWSHQPFIGFFLEQNNVVSTTGQNDWSGCQAGIAHPEQLVAVDDQALDTTTGLSALLKTYQPGDEATLTLTSPDGGRRTVSVELSTFASSDLVSYFVIPYLIGLAYLIIGIWVFHTGGLQSTIWGFTFFCILMALLMGAFFDLHTSHIFVLLWAGALSLIGAAFAHIAVTFPRDFVPRRAILYAVAVYVPGVLLFVYTGHTAQDMSTPWAYIPSMRLSYLFSILAFLLLLGSQIYRLRHADSPIQRQQSRAFLLGSICAFGPLIGWMVLESLQISIRFYATLFLPFLIIFPLTVGYAILRFRLRDIDHLLSRGVAHASIILLLASVYLGMMALLAATFGPDFSVDNPVALVFFLMFALSAFRPLRQLAEQSIDKLLLRSEVDYGQALHGFSQQLTMTLNLERVLELVVQRLENTLHPTHVIVFLLKENLDSYVLAWTQSPIPDPDTLVFRTDGALPQHMRATRETVYFPAEDMVPGDLSQEWAPLQELDMVLIAPLYRQEKLVGWLALGPKHSGRPYGRGELSFLEALANQSALAIENARLYTELERRLAELERAQTHLIRSEKMASLGRLSADVAHEIGNPLSYVTGYLELLWEDTPADAPQRRYLQTAKQQLDRISALVQQLLQMSRPSHQHWDRTNINELVGTVLGLIQKKLSYDQIEVVTDLDPNLPAIMTDAGQMHQVFLNLFINAANAMPDGGTLAITTRHEGKIGLSIQVEDTGIGIPEPNLHRVFEPFFTTREEGTGLGLAISYNIVTAHKGTIEVQSQVGQGTCFTIKLPVSPLS